MKRAIITMVIVLGLVGGAGEAKAASDPNVPRCGDPNHPYPIGDLNHDCRVNLLDLAILASHWLEDNTPGNSNSIVQDGIDYYIQTDKFVYNLTEQVEMLFRVTNLGAEDVRFHFSDQVQYHFEVRDNEDVIWFTPKVGFPGGSWFVLSPNGYKEYTETWDMMNDNGTITPDDDFPVDPGSYQVTGSLHPVFLLQEDTDNYVPVYVQIEIIP